jgi:hypothetical protein
MSYTHLFSAVRSSFVATLIIAALLIVSFFSFEPKVGRTQVTDSFIVTQQITDEISFLFTANDVTMAGTIAGLTGGYATGTTRAVIRSNNPTGYNMKLGFSSTTAMSASSSAYINNYTPAVAGVPDFTWVDNAAGGAAEFGYTVMASTTSELDPSFLNNGSACNVGASATTDRCWMNPTTTAASNGETIINSNSPSISSTTTIKFKVAVPNSPSPALPAAFYVATATLTATNNP